MKAGSILVLIIALASGTVAQVQAQSLDGSLDRIGDPPVETSPAASLLESERAGTRSWRKGSAAGALALWGDAPRSPAGFQATPQPPVIGAFFGLIAGAGLATFQMSNSEGDPDATVMLYLPVGALAGYLAVRLYGEVAGS